MFLKLIKEKKLTKQEVDNWIVSYAKYQKEELEFTWFTCLYLELEKFSNYSYFLKRAAEIEEDEQSEKYYESMEGFFCGRKNYLQRLIDSGRPEKILKVNQDPSNPSYYNS